MADGMTADESRKRLTLADGVQIYYNGADELRLRKGIWNFEEGVLSFDGLSKDQTKLRGWPGQATIGSEAQAAAEKLKKKS